MRGAQQLFVVVVCRVTLSSSEGEPVRIRSQFFANFRLALRTQNVASHARDTKQEEEEIDDDDPFSGLVELQPRTSKL